ncbi:MAG: rhodanese-like domain-containing protein [Gammaproteobacteria bacterium]|nr:rhodanese-like domain-containing protein [Gammaproteobacteria bacterium]
MLLVHVASRETYDQAHIPGAVLVEPKELIDGSPPATGRLPGTDRLTALFGRLGYHANLDIVAYDDEGGGWAGRFIWTLDIIGHRRSGYLNGGLMSWHGAELPLEAGFGAQPEFRRVNLTLNDSPIAELEDVLIAIDDPEQIIWDVRSKEEFLGLRRTSNRSGHIPGAVHLDWMELKDSSNNLRLTANLEELLAAHGLVPEKSIITHCHTHHRSGLSYLTARLCGFEKIRAYHGSWAEWGNRDDTPITGP